MSTEHLVAELDLPDSDAIHELLEYALIGADDINRPGDPTKKYYVAERPDLLVRQNDDDFEPMCAALEAASKLEAHGVTIVPWHAVVHDGETYVITQHVTGSNLAEVSLASPNHSVYRQVDVTWRNLAHFLAACRISGDLLPADIYTPNQYMNGSTATDPSQRLRLVDLPTIAARQEADGVGYTSAVLQLANGIVEAESQANRRLILARAAAQRIMPEAHGTDSWQAELVRLTTEVLHTGTPTYEW